MISTITHTLHQHPEYGMLIAFCLALLESLPFLGSLFPGMLTMPIIGWLMASQRIPAVPTFALIIIGALIGDYIGFYMGVFCKNSVEKLAKRYQLCDWFATGKSFVGKYGLMSIVIGRFIGPFRSSVPLFAGIFDMNRFHFAIAALPSVALWAIVYLAPGMLVHWFNYDILNQFDFLLHGKQLHVLTASALMGTTFVSAFFLDTNRTWNFLYPYARQCCYYLGLPQGEALTLQKVLHMIVTIGCLLFLITHDYLTPVNQSVYRLVSGQHSMLIQLALFYNALCYIPLLLLLSVVFCLHHHHMGHYHSGQRILLSTSIAFVTCFIIKYTAYYPRPEHVALMLGNQSLPSGHTCLTTALALSLAAHYSQSHRNANLLATLSIILTMLIRVVIGAHWVSDVIVGWLLGYTTFLLSGTLLRHGTLRQVFKYVPVAQWQGDTLTLSTSSLLISYAVIAMLYAALTNHLSVLPYLL